MAAVFKFKADGSQYSRGLNQMRDQTKKFSASVGTMLKGAFAFAGIAGIKRLMSEMDRIQKLSLRFGISAEAIQRMGFAAEQGGASMEILAKGLANANRMAVEATRGIKTYERAFADLNINAHEFIKLDQEEQFMVLADAVRYATDQNKAMAASQTIMGRAAMEMRAMMLKGSEGYREVTDGLKTMTQEQVDAAAAANDAINKFTTNAKVVLVDFTGFLSKMIKGARAAGGQMALDSGGIAVKLGRVWKAALSGQGTKQAFAELKGYVDDLRGGGAAQVKLAFEEGVYGQELEDMMRERAAKGLAGGLETIRDITSGLITAGQPKEEDPEALKIQDKIAAEKKKQAEAEMKDKEKLASLDEEIAKGLEEYAVIAAEEGKDSIKAKEKELELLKLQTEQKDLQRKIAADEKSKKEKDDKEKEKAAEDKAKEEADARENVAETKEQIAAERKAREEMGMSDEELLARRQAELKQQEQELAGLGQDANDDGKIDTADDQFRADKELELENLKSEIKGLELGIEGDVTDPQTGVISSSLAAIGGGGGVAAFGDPVLTENKKQTTVLEGIRRAIEKSNPETSGVFENPEL